MGILDSVLGGLPSLSSVSNKIVSEAVSSAVKPVSQIVTTNLAPLNEAISYTMAPVNQLVTEAKGAITSAFGDVKLPFNSVTNGLNIVSASGLSGFSSINGTASASSINQAGAGSSSGSTSYKVKLVADGDEVAFDMTPDVAESISIDYEPLSPPQMPGEFMKYRGTKATTWTITATLTCRTRAEASLRYRDILVLRGWSKTFFGDKQKTDVFGSTSKLGAPPPVVQFSGWRGVVGPVPTVMTSLQVTWPRDVDWIQTNFTEDGTSELIPFPTVMQVTINLTESFSADQFNSFDLAMFKNGKMVGAWAGSSAGNANTGEAVGATASKNGIGISSLSDIKNSVKSGISGVTSSITGSIKSGVSGITGMVAPGTENNIDSGDTGNAAENQPSTPTIQPNSRESTDKLKAFYQKINDQNSALDIAKRSVDQLDTSLQNALKTPLQTDEQVKELENLLTQSNIAKARYKDLESKTEFKYEGSLTQL